jgi:hypothetical protein
MLWHESLQTGMKARSHLPIQQPGLTVEAVASSASILPNR